MILKKYFFITFLCINLLSSQLGLNIYLLYCCCTKNASYSLVPTVDTCKPSGKKNKSCCTKSASSQSPAFKKLPCSNKSIDFKSLHANAERPFLIDFFALDIINSFDYSIWTAKNKISQKLFKEVEINRYYNSGNQLRKKYCSLTC